MKRNHVPGERIDPNEIVRPPRGTQEDSGIPDMHMMLGRRPIGKIFLSHADDRRIELNHVEIEFRPSMGEPLGQRSASMAKDQTLFRF